MKFCSLIFYRFTQLIQILSTCENWHYVYSLLSTVDEIWFMENPSFVLQALEEQFITFCLVAIADSGAPIDMIFFPLFFLLQEWVANFEKPKGDPSAYLKPATTVLSPYLKVS